MNKFPEYHQVITVVENIEYNRVKAFFKAELKTQVDQGKVALTTRTSDEWKQVSTNLRVRERCILVTNWTPKINEKTAAT